ncbi:hypothetical protein GCM10023213_44090 [Prosthecobacter algae]|uniref:Uncharacterized protein n=1 Tax=Prosthecobacter algae TaxID=1144682 RepID=A0ABP9PKS5_9BACT
MRSIPEVGNGRSRELCEALELARRTLQADHFRFFTSNHSRPVTATIKTMMMLHGVDEVGSSLGVVSGFASGAIGVGGCTTGGFGAGVVSVVCGSAVPGVVLGDGFKAANRLLLYFSDATICLESGMLESDGSIATATSSASMSIADLVSLSLGSSSFHTDDRDRTY